MKTLVMTLAILASSAGFACEACHGDKILHEHLMRMMAERQSAGASNSATTNGSSRAQSNALSDDFFAPKAAPADPAPTTRHPIAE